MPLSVIVYYFVIKRFFGHFITILFKTLGQSLLVQLSQVVSAIFILASIQTFDQTLEYIFVFLISSIVAAMPITIGGIGSREVTFLFGAQIMHLEITNSIALSLLFYIITATVSLFGIIYSIKTERLK
ncbi:MAG: flippase-like domain-containing protein [Mariniphaga sp.]|nr:flippase-like domain-containing protein [Mariniphaga sp.]